MNIRVAVVTLTEALPSLTRMLRILIFITCSMTNVGRQMMTVSRNSTGDVSVLPPYVGWYDLAKHCLLHVLASHNGHRVPTINFIACAAIFRDTGMDTTRMSIPMWSMHSLLLPSGLGILSCLQPSSDGAKRTNLSVREMLLELSRNSRGNYYNFSQLLLLLMISNKLAHFNEMLQVCH